MQKYLNRLAAGKVLAQLLTAYEKKSNVIVLALPRGGVPVAYAISKILSISLDIFIVRKLGVPGHEELAMGAIATGGEIVFNNAIVHELGISKSAIEHVIQSEKKVLQQREILYRNTKPFPILTDKIIILVDDGIATGATVRAAIQALRKKNPASIILAVPVAADAIYQEIEKLTDQMVCPLKPSHFNAVGAFYDTFEQTSDAEVFQFLNEASHHRS